MDATYETAVKELLNAEEARKIIADCINCYNRTFVGAD